MNRAAISDVQAKIYWYRMYWIPMLYIPFNAPSNTVLYIIFITMQYLYNNTLQVPIPRNTYQVPIPRLCCSTQWLHREKIAILILVFLCLHNIPQSLSNLRGCLICHLWWFNLLYNFRSDFRCLFQHRGRYTMASAQLFQIKSTINLHTVQLCFV